jgi:hypothetical protein
MRKIAQNVEVLNAYLHLSVGQGRHTVSREPRARSLVIDDDIVA